jgi:hypothetical protein
MRYAMSDWGTEDMADLTSHLTTAIQSASDNRTNTNPATVYLLDSSTVTELGERTKRSFRGAKVSGVGPSGNKQCVRQHHSIGACCQVKRSGDHASASTLVWRVWHGTHLPVRNQRDAATLEQTPFAGLCHCLGSVGDAHLLQDILDLALDRDLTPEQPLRDFSVRRARGDHL